MAEASPNLPTSSEPSGCPTPLNWEEVVRNVVADATEATVEIDGATLTWLEFGSGRRLFVLPGVTGTSRLFALTAWLLKDEYRCILLDHPRWSSPPRPKNLIPATAALIARLLPSFAAEGLDVYGYGYGGQVALEVVSRSPDLVESAILQGAWGRRRFTFIERGILQLAATSCRTLRSVPMWGQVQASNHRCWFPPFDQSRFDFLMQQVSSTPARDASLRLRGSAATDLRSLLPRLDLPVLLVRAEGEGGMISAAMDELKRGLPRAREEWMHTTGHFPFLTHPHRLAKIMRTWRDEIAQDRVASAASG